MDWSCSSKQVTQACFAQEGLGVGRGGTPRRGSREGMSTEGRASKGLHRDTPERGGGGGEGVGDTNTLREHKGDCQVVGGTQGEKEGAGRQVGARDTRPQGWLSTSSVQSGELQHLCEAACLRVLEKSQKLHT